MCYFLTCSSESAPKPNPITAAFKTRTVSAYRNIAQAFDSIPESRFLYGPTPAQLTFGYIAQHLVKDSFTFCENAFAQLDDAKLAESTTMTFGGNTRTVTRAQMALGHALDIADHYSQLANYMRLINMLPPTALPRPAGRGGQ